MSETDELRERLAAAEAELAELRSHVFEAVHYLSTWCFHDRHEQCKGRCKMVEYGECNRECMCDCHKTATKNSVGSDNN